MTSHLVYRNNGALIKQIRETVEDRPGVESLFKIQDTWSEGYSWKLVSSWQNTSGVTGSHSETFTYQTRNKSGTEWTINGEVGGAFSFLSIKIGGQYKSFSEQETTKTTSVTRSYEVPPHTSIFFYQKVYHFRVVARWANDAFGGMWNVGRWNNYVLCSMTGLVDIDSNEIFTPGVALNGEGYTIIEELSNRPYAATNYITRKGENCGWYARRHIAGARAGFGWAFEYWREHPDPAKMISSWGLPIKTGQDATDLAAAKNQETETGDPENKVDPLAEEEEKIVEEQKKAGAGIKEVTKE